MPQGWQATDLGYAAPDLGWAVASRADSRALFRCSSGSCRRVRTPFEPFSVAALGGDAAFSDGLDVRGREALLSTSDGGAHWSESLLPQSVSSVPNPEVYNGAGADGQVRWVCRFDVLLLSADGGASWKQVNLGSYLIQSASFSSPDHGLLVLASVAGLSLWRTEDGGSTLHFVR